MKKSIVVFLALALLAASVPAFATDDGSVVGDTLFARPLGLAAIVGGAAVWIVSLPFAAVTGSLDQTTRTLITNPVKYTFARPMGDFYYEPTVSPKEYQK